LTDFGAVLGARHQSGMDRGLARISTRAVRAKVDYPPRTGADAFGSGAQGGKAAGDALRVQTETSGAPPLRDRPAHQLNYLSTRDRGAGHNHLVAGHAPRT